MPNPALHRFAVFTAACTFLLLIAGALVTSNDAGLAVPDWPLSYGSLLPPMVGGIFWEHGHRLVATLVGILTIILAVWISWSDPRPWVRKLGWAALGVVMAQGILGGITVKFFLPPPVSLAHACLAQLFLCMTVTLALVTSRWWLGDVKTTRYSGHPRLQMLSLASVVVIFLQLLLGAAVRHRLVGIEAHMAGALVVLWMVIWTRGSTRDRRFNAPPVLARLANIPYVLVFVQMFLGVAAYVSRLESQQFPQPIPVMVGFTVAHVAVGAMTLAASLLLALGCFRVLRTVPGASLSSPAHGALREVAP